VALIRRVVQWRTARGELESAYSLAHLVSDYNRAALEDVYCGCAAARKGGGGCDARVMAAVRDRLAETAPPAGEPPVPSAEELSRLGGKLMLHSFQKSRSVF